MSFHFKGSSPKFSNKTIIALSILALLVPTIYVVTHFARPTSATWFDESWSYRQAINIPSHTSSEDDVYVTAPTFDATDTTRYQADCGDLRFTTQAGDLLPYYVVDCDATADIHVNFPTLPAGASTYYMYYGNPAADNGFSASDFSTAASGLGTQTTDSEELSPGPIAHWKFDEGYGVVAQNSAWKKSGTITNLVSNPTLDTNTTGWVTSGGNSTLSQTATESVFGSGSGQLVGATDYSWARPKYDSISVSPSTTYTMTAWVKAGTGGSGKTVLLDMIGDNSGENTGGHIVLTNEWQRMTMSKTTNASDTTLTISIPISNDASGFTFYFDGVQLEANSTTTSYCDGSLIGNGSHTWSSTAHASSSICDYGNDGTITGATWQSEDLCISGKCLSFDGSSEDNVETSPATIPNNGTLATWIKGSTDNQVAENIYPFGFYQFSLLGPSGGSNDNRSGLIAEKDGTNTYWDWGGQDLYDNNWHYYAITWDDTNIYLYIDGKQIGSPKAISGNLPIGESRDMLIGSSWTITYGPHTGFLDEPKLYPYARTADQIKSDYNARGTSSGTSAMLGAVSHSGDYPIAHYKMDEGTGTTSINDSSGNGNTGTMTGSMTESDWVIGRYGKALEFDGSDDYIQVSHNSIFNSDTITLQTWVYVSGDTNTDRKIIAKSRDSESYGGSTWQIRTTTDTNDLLYQTKNGSTWQTITASDFFTGTGWYNVAVTHDTTSDTINIYKNGINTSYTGTITQDFDFASDDLYIGSREEGGAAKDFWNGKIDDVRIYDYARTSGQIIEDMNSGHPLGGSPISSKVGHWKFDEGYGTTAHNSGYGDNNGTITGATWSNAGKFGKALSFVDDSSNRIDMSTDYSEITTELSVSAWVNSTAIADGEGRVIASTYDYDGTPANIRGWMFGNTYGSDDVINFQIYDSSGNSGSTSIPSFHTDNGNKWVYLTGTYKSSEYIRLYMDGVLISEDTSSIPAAIAYSGATNLRIGTRADTTAQGEWVGSIDEVKIYSAALTAEEILIDMNQGSAMVLGSLSNTSGLTGGSVASSSASSAYCIPGDTTSCAPPIGEWKFEEKTGTTAYDTSGNGYDGILTNSPSWTNGKIGSALEFNSTDYISTSLDIYDLYTAGGFTIEAWSYHTATGSYDTILSSFKHTPYDGMFLRTDSGGTNLGCYMYNAGSSNGVQTTNEQNVWIHWTCSYSGGVLKLYKNGKYITQDASASMSDPANTILIGANYTGNENWEGKLDDVRIYDYARTPAQVAYDYNRGGPVGHWKLDECQGTTSYDSSGNDNHGTVTIGATGTNTTAGTCTTSGAWYDGVTGKLNSSLDFDGTDDYTVIPTMGIFDGSKSFTLGAWIKPDTIHNGRFVISLQGERDWKFGVNTNGNFEFNVWDGSSHQVSFSQNTGEWQHFIGTYDKSNGLSLYKNGSLVDTDSWTGTAAVVSRQSAIGAEPVTFGSYFDGQIDDVQIFNYALTPQQVKQVMNQSSAIRFGPTL